MVAGHDEEDPVAGLPFPIDHSFDIGVGEGQEIAAGDDVQIRASSLSGVGSVVTGG
jgi:hypothetical protein